MDRPGITKREICEAYNVTPGTLNRWVREQDWPTPIGKRGAFAEWDPAAVADAVERRRRRTVPAAVVELGSRLLTQAEIAEVFGLDPGTVRADATLGRLGEPVVRDGVRMFPADQVARIVAERRPYRKE